MCNDKEEKQPEILYSTPPEYAKQMELFSGIQEPYIKSQYQLYKDVYEPGVRSLGGELGDQLKQPLQLPEDVWANIWQKSAANVKNEYDPLRQQAGERFAGKGMLNQPVTEKYFQNLDLSQAKSMETMAVDMAIQEWTEKKTAKQQAIQNSMAFQGYQPTFNLPMPTSTAYTKPGDTSGTDFGSMGALGGAGALGLASLLVPGTGIGLAGLTGAQLAGIGGLGGYGLGSLFE
jgi:hypothetical protein